MKKKGMEIMKNFNYVIKDEVGIHARPAGILVKEAKKYQSKIVIVKNGKKAEATKLMALMGLGVKCGDEVMVEVSGEDEDTASREIKAFFENNL
jgi:phosphocarrier protein HPr